MLAITMTPAGLQGNCMTFKDGDFLEVEYTVRDMAGNSILATTDEKIAKDAKIYDEKLQYGPVLVVLGSAGVVKGLDRELRSLAVNQPKKLAFKPEDAFGERSEDLVRVMPMSDFHARDIRPYPGMRLDLDGVTAIVKSVSGGRVVVDANHPYAGKEITYDVRIVRQLTEEKDKVAAIGRSYGIKPTSISVAADRVELGFDSKVNKNADYFIGRANLIASAFTYLKGIKSIDVREEYSRPEENAGKQGK